MNKYEFRSNLTEFITELKYNEKATRTLNKYDHNIKYFINLLVDEKEITKDDVLEFKRHLIEDEKFRTSTVNNYIVSVNKFLKWCNLNHLTVKQIKQQRKSSLNEVLSLTDYKRLLRIAKTNNKNDTYLIMKILAMTGIRIDELKYFRFENLKTNYINVNNKGKERVIVLRQDLYREIKQYCRTNKITHGYIFQGEIKGKMPDKSTIWRRMRRIAGQARVKISKVHAHSFRHLFAKMFLEEYNGAVTELADILGHNSLETTRIYSRTTDEEKRKKLERISFS